MPPTHPTKICSSSSSSLDDLVYSGYLVYLGRSLCSL
nr:MAG TPA: hypothetical protein [Caudoviricetes sp.]